MCDDATRETEITFETIKIKIKLTKIIDNFVFFIRYLENIRPYARFCHVQSCRIYKSLHNDLINFRPTLLNRIPVITKYEILIFINVSENSDRNVSFLNLPNHTISKQIFIFG